MMPSNLRMNASGTQPGFSQDWPTPNRIPISKATWFHFGPFFYSAARDISENQEPAIADATKRISEGRTHVLDVELASCEDHAIESGGALKLNSEYPSVLAKSPCWRPALAVLA